MLLNTRATTVQGYFIARVTKNESQLHLKVMKLVHSDKYLKENDKEIIGPLAMINHFCQL